MDALGTNTYTGPTAVQEGTLRITNPTGLGKATDVLIAQGAKLDLDFSGVASVAKLMIDGKFQSTGSYWAANCPGTLLGKGKLVVP